MTLNMPLDPSADSFESTQTLSEETAEPVEAVETPEAPEEEYQAKYQALYEQHLRLAADFDNFRKRRLAEQEQTLKYGAENTLRALLPALDNLERAQASLKEDSDPKVLYQSFKLVQGQLLDALASLGLKRLESVGQAFNPAQHEAVGQLPSADVPEETVLAEQQAGYLLHDKLIRPAMVLVAAAPVEEASVPAGATEETNPFQ